MLKDILSSRRAVRVAVGILANAEFVGANIVQCEILSNSSAVIPAFSRAMTRVENCSSSLRVSRTGTSPVVATITRPFRGVWVVYCLVVSLEVVYCLWVVTCFLGLVVVYVLAGVLFTVQYRHRCEQFGWHRFVENLADSLL